MTAQKNNSGSVATERAHLLSSGVNFRDFGGYQTADGKQLQWGRLYRSGQLSMLTENDAAYLPSLGIVTNCDFRLEGEFSKHPNNLPATVERINLGMDAGGFSTFFQTLREEQLNEAFMIEAIHEVNRQLVHNYQPQLRTLFAALLALNEGALLLNCAAGKDRTGFAVALILSALNVPRETIFQDYLLTALYYRPELDRERHLKEASPQMLRILTHSAVTVLAEVRREYLQTAFDEIDATWGSMDVFLEQVCGVGAQERQSLSARLTV